jgi:endonuclease G, mitochondrial
MNDAGRLERAPSRARRLLGGARAPAARGLEATESTLSRVGPPDDEDRRAIAARLSEVRATRATPPGLEGRDVAAEADGIAAELVARARSVMTALEGGAADSSVSARDALALEAVIHTRGRPAVRLEADGFEDLSVYPGADMWRVLVETNETMLLAVAGAAGAVAVRDRVAPQLKWVQGTAWLVGPDRAITNRHVLFPPLGGMRLARRIPGTTTARLKTDLEVTLDFAFDNGNSRVLRYRVAGVPFVSADADPVDVAVLTVQAEPGNVATPKPLAVSQAAAFDVERLYVVGHPGRMPSVPEAVRAVFGDPDERKRVSFGQTMDDAVAVAGEVVHDASTIGGFSGGCVLGFLSAEVRALHYFGDSVAGNRAITADALRRHAVKAFL